MRMMMSAFVTMTLLIAVELSFAVSSPSTSPAFLLLPHQNGPSFGMIKSVNYRTVFPSELAKSVMSEGSWSNSLCSGMERPESTVDFAILFVGKKVKSKDIFGPKKTDPILADHLKVFFEDSNSSLAFPYVAASDDNKAIETTLISQFEETCGSSKRIRSIAALGSCSVEGKNVENLADISALKEYMALKMGGKTREPSALIVVCNGGHSEAGIFSQLMNYVKELDSKYTFLYVSDPQKSAEYLKLERLLVESSFGNQSANSTCDGVCQIKSTLLEGIFVGIVLLIILISGLCCMAGIDTPTRFEASQDS